MVWLNYSDNLPTLVYVLSYRESFRSFENNESYCEWNINKLRAALCLIMHHKTFLTFVTAGKFATAVQKYCWPLNTKCN